MKNNAFILMLISIFVLNCSKKTSPPPVQRTYDDVVTDFRKIDFSAGIHDEKLEFNKGVFWDFRIISPEIKADKKYPLVIALHWASGGDPDIHKNTACLIEPGLADLDAFIISPNGGVNLWDYVGNQEMVLNLTDLAKSNWPIDTKRVMVVGYSNGGNGSWFFGETQPDIFSAAIPMASSYTTIHTDGHTRKMPIPMYVIHGEKDALFPLEKTQEWVNKTIDVGSRIKFVVAEGLEHYQACSYVSYLKDGVQWVQDSVWVK